MNILSRVLLTIKKIAYRCRNQSNSSYLQRRRALKPRVHDHFISLGYNCELAYRYVLRNGFLDSNLLAWSYSDSIGSTVYALRNLDRFFTGEISEPSPLYKCANTKISLHGREQVLTWAGGITPKNRAKMEADRAELISRVAYLKSKFLRWLHESDSKLLVAYKIRTAAVHHPEAAMQIQTLWDAVVALGRSNFDFLLVCEQSAEAALRALPLPLGTFVRAVESFNPDDDVANELRGDWCGWRLIFDEFVPRRKTKAKHKFKFEKE